MKPGELRVGLRVHHVKRGYSGVIRSLCSRNRCVVRWESAAGSFKRVLHARSLEATTVDKLAALIRDPS